MDDHAPRPAPPGREGDGDLDALADAEAELAALEAELAAIDGEADGTAET